MLREAIILSTLTGDSSLESLVEVIHITTYLSLFQPFDHGKSEKSERTQK